MLKKITLIILLLIVLAAGWFLATKTFTGKTETADNAELPTDTTADPTLFEPALPFDPDPDGFRFRNYSGRYPEGNLTIAEARAMFGDAVCIRLQNDTCIPHPKVITWLDDMNETMNEVGHCVGFTVASNQLHTDIRSVSELGAEITFDLEQDIPVLRTISQAYASYYASNVWTQEVQGKTPTEIIEALLTLDEPVDIGIFYPEYGRNGHSILGHNVVDQGNGIYHILVYDSNRPGEDNVIVVDTNEDTWFYAEGAVNPDQPTGDYQGDAETKSLTFVPISAYNEPLACPADFAELCPSASSASRFSVLTLFGRGQVLADTADGQIGQSGDTLINTVSGGQFIPVKGELYSRQQPIMLIPSEEAFTLQAQGNQADAPLKISVANPTYSVVVDGLIGQPGQLEQLTFDPAAQQVSFVAGGSQRPLIEFTFNQNGDVYSVQVSGLTFEAGQDLSVTVDATNGDLQLSSEGLAGDEIVLMVTRLNPDGESVFASSEVALLPAATQALDLDSWDGVGPMAVLVDRKKV